MSQHMTFEPLSLEEKRTVTSGKQKEQVIAKTIKAQIWIIHSFIYSCITQLAGSQFPHQVLNPGPCSENVLTTGRQGIPIFLFFLKDGHLQYQQKKFFSIQLEGRNLEQWHTKDITSNFLYFRVIVVDLARIPNKPHTDSSFLQRPTKWNFFTTYCGKKPPSFEWPQLVWTPLYFKQLLFLSYLGVIVCYSQVASHSTLAQLQL